MKGGPAKQDRNLADVATVRLFFQGDRQGL